MILRYLAGRSRYAGLDVRVFLGLYLISSISIFQGGWKSLSVQAVLCLILLAFSGLSLADYARGLGWLLYLLVFISAMSLMEVFSWAGKPDQNAVLDLLSRTGLLASRLLFSLLLVFLLTSSKPSASIRDALDWALRPFSPRLASDFSLAVNVMLAGIPQFLLIASRSRDALRAKGIRYKRHPLIASRMTALHLLRAAALWARQISMAMSARGFRTRVSENPRSGFWMEDFAPGQRMAQCILAFLVATGFVLPLYLF